MDEPLTDSLWQRLVELQRSNYRWRAIALGALVAAAVLAVMAGRAHHRLAKYDKAVDEAWHLHHYLDNEDRHRDEDRGREAERQRRELFEFFDPRTASAAAVTAHELERQRLELERQRLEKEKSDREIAAQETSQKDSKAKN